MKINKPAVAFFILLINVTLVFVFAVPSYRELKSYQSKAVAMMAERSGDSDYYSAISAALREINKKRDAMEKVESALPPYFSFASLANFFHEKSAETGLVVESVEFSRSRIIGASSYEKPLKSITINVKASGEYEHFKKFLASLEKSARIFQMNRISFVRSLPMKGSSQAQSKPQIHRFSLDLEAYSY